jgi:hypothetical protein
MTARWSDLTCEAGDETRTRDILLGNKTLSPNVLIFQHEI